MFHLPILLFLLPLSPLAFGTRAVQAATVPSRANQTPSGTNGSNTTTTTTNTTAAAWSTRMIGSIIARQQGLVSSTGQSTSTLESGLISLGIQAWLDLYSPSSASASTLAPADDATASAFATYVDAILGGVSATAAFTNVTAAALLPLDRLTVAQAIAGLEGEPVAATAGDDDGEEDGDGEGGGGRQLTAEETLALSALNESLVVQERNQFGGFWYYVYPNWSYLDGTVSFLPFMAAQSTSAWSPADALLQIRLLYSHCFQNSTGLLAHGYDASRTAVWADPVTGASPWVWGRSMGWYLLGLVNAWEVLTANTTSSSSSPSSSSGVTNTTTTTTTTSSSTTSSAGPCDPLRDTGCADLVAAIRAQFTTLVLNLVQYQDDATGAWWQLPTAPGAAGNFLESSSTALFACVILKAQRLGLLSPDESPSPNHSSITTSTPPSEPPPPPYRGARAVHEHNRPRETHQTLRTAALRAYDYLLTSAVVVNEDNNATLGFDGTVAVCSLNSTANYTYYVSQPIRDDAPLGEGAFVLASLEVERLGL